MKTRIENETVKPAGITYPALFKHTTGALWLQEKEEGGAMCLHSTGHGAWETGEYAVGRQLQLVAGMIHIPGPITITFNSDKE